MELVLESESEFCCEQGALHLFLVCVGFFLPLRYLRSERSNWSRLAKYKRSASSSSNQC